jgi:hypothetical protein
MNLLEELKQDKNEPWTKDHPEIKKIVAKIKQKNIEGKTEANFSGELSYLKKLNQYFSSEGFDCMVSEKEILRPGMYDPNIDARVGDEMQKYYELSISW